MVMVMIMMVMVMIRRMLMKSTWVAGPPPPLSPTRNCFPSSHCHCILGLEWRLFILCWWWCQCTNHNVQTCNILGWVWVGIILKRGELASPAGWRQWWCWWWEIFHLVANWAPLCCLGSPPVGSLSSSSSSDEEKPLRRLILEPPRTSRKSWNPSSTEALWRRRGVEAPQVTATNGLSFQPRSRLSFSRSPFCHIGCFCENILALYLCFYILCPCCSTLGYLISLLSPHKAHTIFFVLIKSHFVSSALCLFIGESLIHNVFWHLIWLIPFAKHSVLLWKKERNHYHGKNKYSCGWDRRNSWKSFLTITTINILCLALEYLQICNTWRHF